MRVIARWGIGGVELAASKDLLEERAEGSKTTDKNANTRFDASPDCKLGGCICIVSAVLAKLN
jgi:hypothetical protein